MNNILTTLKSKLYAKPSPGFILNDLCEIKLKELSLRYPNHNSNALWIGAYLADMFITEAITTGDITQHVSMALDYAQKIINEEQIDEPMAEIIVEVIATHHGGEQKHIESRIFKNADCFKFLLPRGVFHIFGAMYGRSVELDPEKKFTEAIQYTMFKVEEKFHLVDLDEQLKSEAKELYDHWQFFFSRIGVPKETPPLYSK